MISPAPVSFGDNYEGAKAEAEFLKALMAASKEAAQYAKEHYGNDIGVSVSESKWQEWRKNEDARRERGERGLRFHERRMRYPFRQLTGSDIRDCLESAVAWHGEPPTTVASKDKEIELLRYTLAESERLKSLGPYQAERFSHRRFKGHLMAIKIKPSHEGRLHEKEGVPKGKPIPAKKLAAAENSKSSAERKEAQFAENAKGWHHGGAAKEVTKRLNARGKR